ncbi:hypothetical protein M885DRAFT_612007 [Pelagophyceae sp. CCMP2097]|nr:hypothetical protein M885DRAFT_612007 [Pelagophyceae sp. CCMP2097]|mmetsp:Transcript_19740/g.66772  ORF Transcript_19740/g.66772 Transcript_19740/m.66772 type:complete len:259 (+) Transcript_19740:35-811(+)|eukprot:CAMPEP_0184119408 /NCGR_PEP_ID=MMETSP0974-20121125/21936_1 /TAXON_ID=483370 /ORGANISM="non described non described, Strain CCMP2097" /LENGTH=258 /DNA_ID=CAMNT_0026422573 /DNA_START=29 /DNA_END=805 /DNA_ORIENTATION=-
MRCWLVALAAARTCALVSHRIAAPRLAPLRVFSGIVEEMGTVISLIRNPAMKLWDGSIGDGTELIVRGQIAPLGAYLGCSIAVDGVCLTATELAVGGEADCFKVGLAPETLRRTTLGALTAGARVNLERSLAVDARNSGHYVQGHVDSTGTIIDRWSEDDSLWHKIRAPPELLPYIVKKGYITVDGTSLTVCEVDLQEGWFTLMLVGHTQQCIVLPTKAVGTPVNLEVDVMAKYAQSAVQALEQRVADLEKKLAVAQA